jgi:hypothetical protein
MLNYTVARCRDARMFAVPSVVFAMLLGYDAWASPADDLPPPSEPELAEPGDYVGSWAADFNEAQIACFNGSMGACDSIWLNDRVLTDTFLHNYGRSCGGRVDLDALRRAGAFRIGGPRMHCTDIFPGHE